MLFRSFFTAGLAAVAIAAPVVEIANGKAQGLIDAIKKLDGTVQSLYTDLSTVKKDALRKDAKTILSQLDDAIKAAKALKPLSPGDAAPLNSVLADGNGFIAHVKKSLAEAATQKKKFSASEQKELLGNLKSQESKSKTLNDSIQAILPGNLKSLGKSIYAGVQSSFTSTIKAYGG